MGLLDSVLGAVMGGSNNGNNGGSPLLQVAMQLLNNQNGGGLGGLVNNLQKAGLGDQVASWIGTGSNLPVSGDQIAHALGNGQITDIAQKLGLNQSEVAGGLADMLPQLIDRVTPNGQLPQGNSLDSNLLSNAMSMFLKR